MDNIVKGAFRAAIEQLREEVEVMPVSQCTESVFRYFFCRSLRMDHRDVWQDIEYGEIDLVLHLGDDLAFVEFKFYRSPRRFDPYNQTFRGYKGGPGPKNRKEFQKCVEKLRQRPPAPGLSKYIVLVYSDPTDCSRRLTFSENYDDYQHVRSELPISEIARSEDFFHTEGVVKGRLFNCATPSSRNSRRPRW